MEEHSLYTHYLSCRKDEPERELSENTKKIIALVESEDFLELNKYWLSDARTLQKIVYSARADVRYKLELLNGIMEEFKDDKQWEEYERGEQFMEYYEQFRMAVDLMKSADNVFFTLTKVTRGENNSYSRDNNYPEFSSVDEISKYLESHFDEMKDSEDDPEWYIVWRYENNKIPSLYLLSKRGTVWKCGKNYYYTGSYIEFENYDEIDSIGIEINDGQFIADYGDIIVSDGRPFRKVFYMIYANDDGEDEGLYVEDGKLKTFPIEYHVTGFEEFAFELRSYIQEDMSKLSEQEDILLRIQQKYRSMGEDGYKFLVDIDNRVYSYKKETGTEGMPIDMVEEEFLR